MRRSYKSTHFLLPLTVPQQICHCYSFILVRAAACSCICNGAQSVCSLTAAEVSQCVCACVCLRMCLRFCMPCTCLPAQGSIRVKLLAKYNLNSSISREQTDRAVQMSPGHYHRLSSSSKPQVETAGVPSVHCPRHGFREWKETVEVSHTEWNINPPSVMITSTDSVHNGHIQKAEHKAWCQNLFLATSFNIAFLNTLLCLCCWMNHYRSGQIPIVLFNLKRSLTAAETQMFADLRWSVMYKYVGTLLLGVVTGALKLWTILDTCSIYQCKNVLVSSVTDTVSRSQWSLDLFCSHPKDASLVSNLSGSASLIPYGLCDVSPQTVSPEAF